MKIFLIFSLFLISAGPVGCVEVTGYKGGSVLINCIYDYMKYKNHTKYFCKLNQRKECTDQILLKTQNPGAHDGRFILMDETQPGTFSVLIKNVSQQDGGTYRCGVEDKTAKPTDVTLQVKEDPCCGKTLTQKTHPGETVTFTCEYPQESKYLYKYLYKVTDHSYHVVIFALGLSAQNGRFSLFDHPQENLFNVSISDVTEEDGGVYLCGVQGQKKGDLKPYYSLFNEIQLHVTHLGTSTGSSVIIIVCVCVALLLIGGLLLIYKLRRNKAEGSSNMRISTNNTANGDYENDPPGNQNVLSRSPVYQNQNPNIIQSYSAYQSLNPNTNQSDSAYQSLNPSTNQSDSAYQSLNPNTNQSDSAYQ
ncbi:polymeric immunoglobulin receptor-like, partial [Colossoma macropomum]|uniref:polymeric immunoglobulin receptor-like n=1 Tax=Colossoma macropomum TaxID=42526 RepID=UPI001864BE75